MMGIRRTAAIIVFTYGIITGSCTQSDKIDGSPCASSIFCHGEFLKAIQMSGIFDSAKDFVDRPAKTDPAVILNDFENLGNRKSETQLRELIDKHFGPIGSDLEQWSPPDFKPANLLPFFGSIKDRNLRHWAEELHGKWREFGRKESAPAEWKSERTSLIHLPNPFLLNGFEVGKKTGRFREQRYWDSYFLIHGLLISGMNATVKGMILNFAELVEKFGYVPIGNRIYYQNRPQMPLLSSLVHLYWIHNNDDGTSLVRSLLPTIEKEYGYWISKSIDITVDGKLFSVNRYKSNVVMPRPESYREDQETAARTFVGDRFTRNRSPPGAEGKLFASISAASASGWEFSTRWLDKPTSSLAEIQVENIIPVDLNAILCANERHLSEFHKIIGDDEKAEEYLQKSVWRGDTIQAVFWNESLNMWRDYNLRERRHREDFYLSSITPLFTMCSPRKGNFMSTDFLRRVMSSVDMKKALEYPGGMPVSFNMAQQTCPSCQWDFPNTWPSLQLQLVEALAKNPEMLSVANELAQKMITAIYGVYVKSENMFENYDVRENGNYGLGGEYVIHQGYAPTNGVILRLLELFPSLRDLQDNEIRYEVSDQQTESQTAATYSNSAESGAVPFIPEFVSVGNSHSETTPDENGPVVHRTRQEPVTDSPPNSLTKSPLKLISGHLVDRNCQSSLCISVSTLLFFVIFCYF